MPTQLGSGTVLWLQEEAELSPERQAPGFLCDRETRLVNYTRVNRINAPTNLHCSTGTSSEMAFTVPGIPVRLCWSLVNLCETENLQKVKTATRILNSIWRSIQTRQKGQWADQGLIRRYQGPEDFRTVLPRHSLTRIRCRKDLSFQMFTLERNLRGWKLERKS